MHLHEYQAKMVLQEHNIPIPDFVVVSDIAEAENVLRSLKLSNAVLKVQVHAGGRGKAGGIKMAKSPNEILDSIRTLLGMKIVNAQTGKEGVVANQVMISSTVNIEKEYYLAITIDRHIGQAVLIASQEGGMDIEEVAARSPEKIKTLPIPLNGHFRNYQLIEILKFMGWSDELAEQGKAIIKNLTEAFFHCDALLLEINPLVLSREGQLIALDAKLTIDDNALFRQSQLAEWDDPTQLNPFEARAKEFDLAYIALEGNIGCMVNGAGLAMATMDIIQHYGGKPANFLDVGGGASEEKIAEGFKILLSDPKVEAILVNIFGGIMNCVTLAGGIISATSDSTVHVPVVIRMEGTNVETGRKLLADSALDIIIANDLAEAAEKAVAAVRRKK